MTPRDEDRYWTEEVFDGIPIPYQIIFLIVLIILYLCYLSFSRMIGISLNLSAHMAALSMSTLIAYQMAGTRYLMGIMDRILFYIGTISGDDEEICFMARRRLSTSRWCYVVMAVVILPFYLIDFINPSEVDISAYFLPLYNEFPSLWSLLFDLFIDILGLLALFLLSIILWIMFNITWTLRDAVKFSFTFEFIETIFSIKRKTDSINGLILNALICYFIAISLAVLSYLNPNTFYSRESFILLILLLIGAIFFFLGLDATGRILKGQIEVELDIINKKSQEQIQKLIKITPAEDYDEKAKEINYISNLLEILRKQREDIESIPDNVYSFRSVGTFLSSSLLPILTGVLKSHTELTSRINEVITMFADKIYNLITNLL